MSSRLVAISTFVLVALLAQGTAMTTVRAFDLSIGLDRDTLNAINILPDNIRKALFKLVQDSLPLIDASVNGYIAHVNQVLKDNINEGIDHLRLQFTGGG